jgi:hypothetical protein
MKRWRNDTMGTATNNVRRRSISWEWLVEEVEEMEAECYALDECLSLEELEYILGVTLEDVNNDNLS